MENDRKRSRDIHEGLGERLEEMESRVCLDTNILVDILRGNIETVNLIKNIKKILY